MGAATCFEVRAPECFLSALKDMSSKPVGVVSVRVISPTRQG